MKHLKRFNESNYITILDEEVEKALPQEIEIYSTTGTYKFKMGDFTREIDILRAVWTRNDLKDSDYDAADDGDPDNVGMDLHFVRNENGVKILADVTYGDNMACEFSIEAPNKVKVGHYTGVGSKIDPDTNFAFSDETLDDFVKFFNSFKHGYRLSKDDFHFLDKYPETYHTYNESVKITPFLDGSKILILNSSKENKYIRNLLKYLQIRGIDYVIASTSHEIRKILVSEKIIGSIFTGDENEYDNISPDGFKLLSCPILGICEGLQAIGDFYGSKVYKCEKPFIDNKILTEFRPHELYKDINMKNCQFGFNFNNYLSECPKEFYVIAKLDDKIVGIANDTSKRYGVLFRPEDMERTYPILDNFISMCHPVQKNLDNLQRGISENIKPFNKFVKLTENKNNIRYIKDIFDDIIEEFEEKGIYVHILSCDEINPLLVNPNLKDLDPDIMLSIEYRFEYNEHLYKILNSKLEYLSNFNDINLVLVEYMYLVEIKRLRSEKKDIGYEKSYSDSLYEIDEFNKYVNCHKNMLSSLKLYFKARNTN